MGGAGSLPALTDAQKVEAYDDLVGEDQFKELEAKLMQRLQKGTSDAGSADDDFSSAMLTTINEQLLRVTTRIVKADQLRLQTGASQSFRTRGGKTEKVVAQSISNTRQSKPQWRYNPGDVIKNMWGQSAYIVQNSLGCGAFGEVHVVRNQGEKIDWYGVADRKVKREWNGVEHAMKCTKFSSMSREQRLGLFLPLCEEAELMASIKVMLKETG